MGRHGGINILHQKSWHVWRLDNQLTVERDELKHAAQEREKLEAEQKAVFDEKVARLRRRALGLDEEPPAPPACPTLESIGGSSSSSAGAPGRKGRKADKNAESSYKWGRVTTSNLKQAEQDLELMLKGRKQPERYWGSGGLGTGPHINLFEEAELDSKRHLAEHEKQIQYTARNNELAQKSKKALFSEFDEISRDQPWYARSPKAPVGPATDSSPAAAGSPADVASVVMDRSRSRSRPGCELRRRWTERHGQALLRVSAKRRRAEVEDTRGAGQTSSEGGANTRPLCKLEEDAAPTELVESSEDSPERRKERRKLEKEERRRRKRTAKADKKAEELRALRAERERREREEHARAARLISGAAAAGAWCSAS